MILMQLFDGNLSKFIQTPKNCLVVGTGLGFLNELLMNFNTVFVTGQRPNLRERNLIYIEDNLVGISFISLIVLDNYSNIDRLFPILDNQDPLIVIAGTRDEIDLQVYETLKKRSYYIVEFFGGHHLLRKQQ